MRLFALPLAAGLVAGAAAPRLVVSVGHAGDPDHAVFVGNYLVTEAWSNVAIIDLASGLTVATLPQGSIVSTLEASPRGDLVAVGHCGHGIDLIDVRSRMQVRRIDLKQECAESLSFSPDGVYLATEGGGCCDCSPGGTLQVWKVGSGKLAKELATESAIRHVVFAGTGRWLAGLDTKGKATIFEWPSGRPLKTFEGLSQPGYSGSELLASGDGQFLGWLGGGGIRVWEVGSGAEVPLPGEREATVFNFPPDGPERQWTERRVFATAAAFLDDGRLAYIDGEKMVVRTLPNGPQRVWQLDKPRTEWHGDDVGALKRSSWLMIRSDGLQLAGAYEAQTVIWDVARARLRVLTAPSLSFPSSLRWSSSGIIAWSGLGSGLQGWDDRAGGPAKLGKKGLRGGVELAFRADGGQLAVGGVSDVSLIDVAKARVLRTREFPPAAGSGVSYSPDGSTLAFGFPPDGFGEFDEHLRIRRHVVDLERYTHPEHVAFSPDGKWLAAGFSGPRNSLRVWPRAGGRDAAVTLDSADVTFGPRPPAFSRDSRWLASFRVDNSLVIWETGSWRIARTLTLGGTGRALAFAPEGTRLAVASDGEATIWDVATAEKVAVLSTPGSAEMREIAWSPDGRRTVASADDGVLRFWSVADGRLLGSLYAFESSAEWLFVTPDGHLDGSQAAVSRCIAWGVDDKTVTDAAITNLHLVRGLWREVVASVTR